jgi:hypothetical protein
MKGRFTEKITSPTSYEFKFEASVDGSEYMTFLEGKATKTGAAAGSKGAEKPAGKISASTEGGKTPKK